MLISQLTLVRVRLGLVWWAWCYSRRLAGWSSNYSHLWSSNYGHLPAGHLVTHLLFVHYLVSHCTVWNCWSVVTHVHSVVISPMHFIGMSLSPLGLQSMRIDGSGYDNWQALPRVKSESVTLKVNNLTAALLGYNYIVLWWLLRLNIKKYSDNHPNNKGCEDADTDTEKNARD